MEIVDLRSDTVTKPTNEMRIAMQNAKVGDDVYGEDPTINELESIAARAMGKAAGLFVPSGTMGNLIATLTHCARGDEVIMGNKGHTFVYEGGGISAFGGIHPHTIPNMVDGTLELDQITNAIRMDDPHFPRTKLIILENTQNRCGGIALTKEYTERVADLAHENELLLHIDGARIFNAAVLQKIKAVDLVEKADSVTFCLSKGLCAPVGSVLCGSDEFIYHARRIRKHLGGGMRQAGILAAAGILAIETMVDRLEQDHHCAELLDLELKNVSWLKSNRKPMSTNMVFVDLVDDVALSSMDILNKLKSNNILVGLVGNRGFRLVTHYGIDEESIYRAVDVFKNIL